MSQLQTNDKNLIFFNYRVKQTLDKLDNFVFAMTYPSKVQFKKNPNRTYICHRKHCIQEFWFIVYRL